MVGVNFFWEFHLICQDKLHLLYFTPKSQLSHLVELSVFKPMTILKALNLFTICPFEYSLFKAANSNPFNPHGKYSTAYLPLYSQATLC